MEKQFHIANRKVVYESMEDSSVLSVFSGKPKIKTADEFYPFFTDRNFLYLTGITGEGLYLVAYKSSGKVTEKLYLTPPDMMIERWTGKRIHAPEAEEKSGISDISYVETYMADIKKAAESGNYKTLYLDFDRTKPAGEYENNLPIEIKSINTAIRMKRTIKETCEIEAMRVAEEITRDGILAMMHASKPEMYEYQYKAEYDYALLQRGVLSPAFPAIISAAENNFCIHYYSYTGQAKDGDMILNDVGAAWDNMCVDVSRGWPCNGKFSEKQRLLYQCAYETSNHMFSIIKPGMIMREVDAEIRRFNGERLIDIGLCKSYEDVGKYMWHGGAHHVGYDVHDEVDPDISNKPIQPNMVFCVDVGIYVEEWGIGFRLEDNCRVTETGCENLSVVTPRAIEDIEAEMKK